MFQRKKSDLKKKKKKKREKKKTDYWAYFRRETIFEFDNFFQPYIGVIENRGYIMFY